VQSEPASREQSLSESEREILSADQETQAEMLKEQYSILVYIQTSSYIIVSAKLTGH
jgi:hypothetical protein